MSEDFTQLIEQIDSTVITYNPWITTLFPVDITDLHCLSILYFSLSRRPHLGWTIAESCELTKGEGVRVHTKSISDRCGMTDEQPEAQCCLVRYKHGIFDTLGCTRFDFHQIRYLTFIDLFSSLTSWPIALVVFFKGLVVCPSLCVNKKSIVASCYIYVLLCLSLVSNTLSNPRCDSFIFL